MWTWCNGTNDASYDMMNINKMEKRNGRTEVAIFDLEYAKPKM